MFRKEIIFIALIIILLVAAVYLIATSRFVEKVENVSIKSSEPTSQINQEELENNYQQEVKKIFKDYLELMSSPELSAQDVELFRGKFLELKVPTSLKDLHLNLVLAMIKMENYLAEGSEVDKLESEQLINQAKNNYVWLNN